ncbi:MAG: PAS domain S-box protein, partial [Proteobacteria bacterium]|nr:PAS domain S-box protein [Pseudomonadota bacterium]
IVYQNDGFKYINPYTCRTLGYSEAELIGRSFADFVHPDDVKAVNERFRRRIEGEKLETTARFKIVTKEKETKWIQNKPVLIDWEGKPAILCFLSEITEQKKMEQARKESDEKFRLLSEQSLMGISIFQDGVYQYVNDATSQLNEYSIEEMMAMKAEEFAKMIHPDDLNFVMTQFRKKQAGKSGYTANYAYRGITKSGKVKWIEQYSKTINYRGRTADLVTVVDITERKKAEEALKASEEKYRNVVMNAIEAICVIQGGRFQYFNPEAVRLFGYPPRELERLPSDETVYRDDRALVSARRLQRETGESETAVYSHRIVTKEGRIRWVEIKSVTIVWNGKPAVLVFLSDITERKQSEELMIQTEKMMSIGGLAAGMAHEINNPLGGILQGIQNV